MNDPDHAAAVRTVRMMLVAAVLVVVGAAVALLTRVTDDGDSNDTGALLGVEAPSAVGPATGSPVAAYVAAQRQLLAEAQGSRVAVVSLVSYRDPDAVDNVLARVGEGAGLEVVARLVALPGGAPASVGGSLADWLDDQRAPLQEERDRIAELLPSIEDPNDPFIPTYTEDLARLDAQLAALDSEDELVFGVVVKADADGLRRLAERPDVRVVAVGATGEVGSPDAYRGIRPEETDVAGTPASRPAPP